LESDIARAEARSTASERRGDVSPTCSKTAAPAVVHAKAGFDEVGGRSHASSRGAAESQTSSARARLAEKARVLAKAKLELAEAEYQVELVALQSSKPPSAAAAVGEEQAQVALLPATAERMMQTAFLAEKEVHTSQAKQLGRRSGPLDPDSFAGPSGPSVSYAPAGLMTDLLAPPFPGSEQFTSGNPFGSHLEVNAQHLENLRAIHEQQKPEFSAWQLQSGRSIDAQAAPGTTADLGLAAERNQSAGQRLSAESSKHRLRYVSEDFLADAGSGMAQAADGSVS
jgi:hypothetical protein